MGTLDFGNTEQATLTVTAKGQVTLRKDVLQHMGVRPGEKIVVDKLPDGELTARAAKPSGDMFKFSWIPAKGRRHPSDD